MSEPCKWTKSNGSPSGWNNLGAKSKRNHATGLSQQVRTPDSSTETQLAGAANSAASDQIAWYANSANRRLAGYAKWPPPLCLKNRFELLWLLKEAFISRLEWLEVWENGVSNRHDACQAFKQSPWWTEGPPGNSDSRRTPWCPGHWLWATPSSDTWVARLQ